MKTFNYKNTSPYSVRINPHVESDLHVFDDKAFSIPVELGNYIGKQPANKKISLIRLLRSLFVVKNDIADRWESNMGLWQAKVIVEKYMHENFMPLSQAFDEARK